MENLMVKGEFFAAAGALVYFDAFILNLTRPF
jgi:hypothetical protein